MELSQKRILIPSLCILTTIAFAAGALLAETYGWKRYQPALGMQNHGQALGLQLIIEEIDGNNIDKAIEKLEMLQNGNVLVLDQLIGEEDEHSELYAGLLQKIAVYRVKVKEKREAGVRTDMKDSEVMNAISNVLRRYQN